jgi:predicted nucleotidyltransferase
MKRDLLLNRVKDLKDELQRLGVKKMVISRECSLEDEMDSTVAILVEMWESTYERYNKVQEFLSTLLYENVEVIPYDFFLISLDDHFDEGATVIDLNEN